jgi:lipopolysaccharide export LptBFGC system permease protein LptF
LTPYSYRVRLLRMTIVQGGNQLQTVPAFMIENDDELANRLGLRREDNHFGHTADDFYKLSEPTTAFFQYFISNGDWSIQTGQNLKLYRTEDEKLVPIAYDFDFSGWVGAPYARKRYADGRLDLQDQEYNSMTEAEAKHRAVREDFLTHREAITRLVKKHRDLKRYVKQFFQKIETRLKATE